MKRIITIVLATVMLLTILVSAGSVNASTKGDVNSDKKINSLDVLILKKHLAKYKVNVDLNSADCNGDRSINSKDVLLLRQYLANWDVEFATTTTTTFTTIPTTQLTTVTTTTTTTQPTESTTAPTTTAKEVKPGWNNMYDWESLSSGTKPNIAEESSNKVSVRSFVSGNSFYYDKGTATLKNTNSKQAVWVYSDTKLCNPYRFDNYAHLSLDKASLSSATNLRAIFHIKEKSQAEVFYIGLRIGTKSYIKRLTKENYSDFNYFYFVGKTMTDLNDLTTEYTIKKEDIPNVSRILFWVETSGYTALLVDDIDFYVGEEGYDSTEEDKALPQPKPLVDDGKDKYICLSFDDGPSSYLTTMLDVMEERNIVSTMFFIGNKMNDSQKDRIARADQLGHQIANHTYSHPHLTTLDKIGVETQLKQTDDLILKYAGKSSTYLRPPFLSVSSTMYSYANMVNIGGYCPEDYNNTSVDYKVEWIKLNCTKDGAVILLHEGYNNAQTIVGIYDYFIALGYDFVTIEDCFEKKNITPRKDFMYNIIK